MAAQSVGDRSIETAQTTDFEALTRIMDRANDYSLEKSGEPAWRLKGLALHELGDHLKAGECFIMRDRQNIVATITITDSDRLWEDKGRDGTALYIHKLMKDPDCHIRNIGLTFLLFAAHEALRQHKKFIRCDTISNQQRLINYYVKLGFVQKASFVYIPSERGGVFLEADVEELIRQIHKRLGATEKF